MTSKTLKRRLAKLEKTVGREYYVMTVTSWDAITYDLLRSSKMEPKQFASSMGPFKSRGEANAWRFRDLQANHPKAYARLLEERSPKDLEATTWLTVDTFPEFVEEMLRTDVDLNTLSEGDRKLRQGYLDHADDARALIAKHAELLRGGEQST